jgi:hypothetical protein
MQPWIPGTAGFVKNVEVFCERIGRNNCATTAIDEINLDEYGTVLFVTFVLY